MNPLSISNLDEASGAIFEVVALANRYVDRTTPWVSSATTLPRLASLVRALSVVARELEPFLPGTARTIAARLERDRIIHGPPLFPRTDQN